MFFKKEFYNFKIQTKEWIAEHRKDIIIFILIFLISSLSFGFGYLVSRESNRAPIIIEKCSNA